MEKEQIISLWQEKMQGSITDACLLYTSDAADE